MSTLTGQYISQSYGGLIQLSTNTGIVTGSSTQLQDGLGTNLGVWLNGQGNVSASTFTGLASNATSASYANTATSASYAPVFPFTGSARITGSLGVTGSVSVTNGLEVKAGDLDFSGGNVNIYNGNLNQFAGAATLQTTVISGSLTLKQGATGSLLGTASFAISASWAPQPSISNLATTGSNTFVGNQTISGSVKGNVTALTITSQTASLNFNTGNFFTLTLASGANTFLNPTNIQPGQTVNLQITQVSPSGSISFPSSVSFPSGSYYTASIANNDVDVISMISFNGTAIRAVASKTFL